MREEPNPTTRVGSGFVLKPHNKTRSEITAIIKTTNEPS